MSTENKPMTPQERIKADAEAYAERENSAYVNDYNGYIAGSTAEHDRVQPVIDAAEKVVKIFAHKGDHQTCAICQLARAIEQWKGKEVKNENP